MGKNYYSIYIKSTKINLDKVESFCQIKKWIKEYQNANKKQKIKVLDVGCGIGYLTNYLNADGIDKNVDAINIAKKIYPNNKFIYGDIGSIQSLIESKYDIMVCYNIIEHLSDNLRIKFFNNTPKILKKDSLIILGYANPYHLVQIFWGFLTRKVLFDKTHIHNWTIRQFIKEVNRYFTILEIKKTSPFTRFIFLGKYFKGDILLKCKVKNF